MFGFVARTLGGAVAPLVERVSITGARLLQKAALFLIAALCLLVVVGALTIAFFLWISSLANPIVAALAVAGLYLLIAVLAVVLALRTGASKPNLASQPVQEDVAARQAEAGIHAEIDRFTAPLLALLAQFGFKREQFAVLAGASIAKQLGPLPLVGLAIVGGFLIGRLGKKWRSLVSLKMIASLLPGDLFGVRPSENASDASEV